MIDWLLDWLLLLLSYLVVLMELVDNPAGASLLTMGSNPRPTRDKSNSTFSERSEVIAAGDESSNEAPVSLPGTVLRRTGLHWTAAGLLIVNIVINVIFGLEPENETDGILQATLMSLVVLMSACLTYAFVSRHYIKLRAERVSRSLLVWQVALLFLVNAVVTIGWAAESDVAAWHGRVTNVMGQVSLLLVFSMVIMSDFCRTSRFEARLFLSVMCLFALYQVVGNLYM